MASDIINYVYDIQDLISSIDENLQGIGYEDFRINRKIKIDVVQSFEKILHCMNSIPDDSKSEYPDIPWVEISNLKDKILSADSGIDEEIVWKAAKIELKQLNKLFNFIFFK